MYAAGIAKITVQDYYTEVKLNENKIIFKSGITCTLKDPKCSDYNGGYVFWDSILKDVCGLGKYKVLYENKVHVTKEENKENSQVMYTIELEESIVLLIQKDINTLCRYKLFMTEHPELFFMDIVTNIINKLNKAILPTANIILSTYMNTKFVYREKNDGDLLRHTEIKMRTRTKNKEKRTSKSDIVTGGIGL